MLRDGGAEDENEASERWREEQRDAGKTGGAGRVHHQGPGEGDLPEMKGVAWTRQRRPYVPCS